MSTTTGTPPHRLFRPRRNCWVSPLAPSITEAKYLEIEEAIRSFLLHPSQCFADRRHRCCHRPSSTPKASRRRSTPTARLSTRKTLSHDTLPTATPPARRRRRSARRTHTAQPRHPTPRARRTPTTAPLSVHHALYCQNLDDVARSLRRSMALVHLHPNRPALRHQASRLGAQLRWAEDVGLVSSVAALGTFGALRASRGAVSAPHRAWAAVRWVCVGAPVSWCLSGVVRAGTGRVGPGRGVGVLRAGARNGASWTVRMVASMARAMSATTLRSHVLPKRLPRWLFVVFGAATGVMGAGCAVYFHRLSAQSRWHHAVHYTFVNVPAQVTQATASKSWSTRALGHSFLVRNDIDVKPTYQEKNSWAPFLHRPRLKKHRRLVPAKLIVYVVVSATFMVGLDLYRRATK